MSQYDLMLAARKDLAAGFEDEFAIGYENVDFTPPADGSMWLKFDYIEVDSPIVSLDRRCRYYVGMVQVSIIFQPGSGTDRARLLARRIADYFYDGKILETGYISEGAFVRPVSKSDSGWMVPVRFYVRLNK